MSEEGHVRLKRWYELGADPEDYYDLTNQEIYYDSINKQYKIKTMCGDCGVFLGWYCYPTDKMSVLLYESDSGIYCSECYNNNNFDIDIDDCELMQGRVCKC